MERLKKLIKWVAIDGLLHILVCYAMMTMMSPVIGFYALIPTITAATVKEWYDYHILKSNNREQALHDIICDAAGIIAACATIVLWLI